MLALPAAWSNFIDTSVGGTSCLGPLAGLTAQKALYAASNAALRSAAETTMVLVARPERASLDEAERTRGELAELGVTNLLLIVNGVFRATDRADQVAVALERRGQQALETLAPALAALPRVDVPLLSFGLVGIDALRQLSHPEAAVRRHGAPE